MAAIGQQLAVKLTGDERKAAAQKAKEDGKDGDAAEESKPAEPKAE